MSTSAKELFDKASAAGKTRKPYLQLGEKQEGGGVKSTGKHVVKIISDKVGTGKDPFTEEPRQELQMVVSENGVEKLWNIPVKDKNGNLHYLVERLAEVPEGATISLEMKSKGMKNYIELRVVGEGEKEIPTIQLNEDGDGDTPPLDGGEDIPLEAIPF